MSDIELGRPRVSAFTVPTEQPESDGTLQWDSVTLVVAEVDAGDVTGIGYTYADLSSVAMIEHTLSDVVAGGDAMSTGANWWAMVRAIRNVGWPGTSATAISALDIALWDVKAKLLGVCLADLLGRVRESVPVYGSGGLTSYSETELCRQFERWVGAGIPRVKMKVGRDPEADPGRVRAARAAIGEEPELFVDANGAYSRTQAAAMAQRFAESDVTWFEEPVSSNDLDGLHQLRERVPAGMAVTAGEYGYTPEYFRALLDAGAVDVLQADVTRACGITGLLAVDGLCTAYEVPFSAHCAPQIHAHAGCAIGRLEHCEYFHTHARAEGILFEGVIEPVDGSLTPDRGRAGLGIELRRGEVEEYRR